MPTVRHQIPQIAKTAMALLEQQFRAQVDAIGRQTVEALGLQESDGWTADFEKGTVWREVPEPET